MSGWQSLLLGLLLAGAIHLVGDRYMQRGSPAVTPVANDTIVVIRYDTLRVPHPIYIAQRTIDTLVVHDTLRLPLIQRTYTDSSYRAWVSGYEARLDSLELYPTHTLQQIALAPRPKRWCIGVTAGYGLSPYGCTPYVGIGLSYKLFEW